VYGQFSGAAFGAEQGGEGEKEVKRLLWLII